ncbi:hypothetical protein [Phenylobacterium sp.]|uniref:hypothetical protein n=1 Tax=Phenylobacterium sp. TaxID=1871053 RepID=UPI0025D64FD6|nr:hypothetical protein [Phenylobacterium sp.]
MTQGEQQTLAAMVQANDKLLKALTVLLAIKDEHLLAELNGVFAAITAESSEIRAGGPDVWDHLRHELALISCLVAEAESEPDETDGGGAGGVVN